MTLDDWFDLARSDDADERAYWLARGLRDAKPDDILTWFTTEEIAQTWPTAKRFVGKKRDFWVWYLQRRGHEVEP